MRRKAAAIQRLAGDLGLDITLQNIVDGVEDEILVIDSEYRVRFANAAVRDRFNKEAESLIGRLCYDVFYGRDVPCNEPLWDCPIRKVLRSGKMTTVIHPQHISGVDRYLKVSAYPLEDRNGKVTAIVELRRDVTAERELETQVLRRHHQLLALSRISSAVSGLSDLDTILRVALDNVLEVINGVAGSILLLDEKTETLYYRVQRGMSAKLTSGLRLHLGEGITGRVAQSGEPILLEDVSKDPRAALPDVVKSEGLKGFISMPLKSKDKVVGVMNVHSHVAGRFGADDVSLLNAITDYLGTAIEQAKLYERLERAKERYQVLLQHALTAQEEQRKSIARELHDETSQALTSLSLSLKAIMGMAEMKGITDSEFMKRLETTHSYAVYAGNEVVKLMKELRPTLLDELGLPAAIHRYAKDSLQVKGIKVTAEFKGVEERLRPEVEVTLFRIAQGAIGNILEHSEAKNVAINLECKSGEVILIIDDDGKGFDVSKLTRVERDGRGAGLFTMRERARLVGGIGLVESQPGKGTRIIVKVPMEMDVLHEKYAEEDKSTDS